MTTQTLATVKVEKWLRYGSGFSQIFDSGSGSGSERKTQNPAGVDSGNPDPVPPLKQSGINRDVFSDQCRHITQKYDTGWEYRAFQH